MKRIEGKIRGYIKERIRCDFCGYEQVSIWPYESKAEGLECSNCGIVIALYGSYINDKGQVIDAPVCLYRK